MISYRLLSERDFDEIHQVFIESFSDYMIEFKPDKEAMRRKFFRERIDYSLSVGAFSDGKMVGFTMNGVGEWHGRKTAYDAGTGVIKNFRRKGVSSGIFEFIIPVLQKNHIKQYLLEVISNNQPAIKLYQKLDFQIQRNLIALKSRKLLKPRKLNFPIEVRKLQNIDWQRLKAFGECSPSWQNSFDSISTVTSGNTASCLVLGLFWESYLIGYGVVFPLTGNLPLLAIDSRFRRLGLGTFLLEYLQKFTKQPLVITNIDSKAQEVLAFFENNGFSFFAKQHEMLLTM